MPASRGRCAGRGTNPPTRSPVSVTAGRYQVPHREREQRAGVETSWLPPVTDGAVLARSLAAGGRNDLPPGFSASDPRPGRDRNATCHDSRSTSSQAVERQNTKQLVAFQGSLHQPAAHRPKSTLSDSFHSLSKVMTDINVSSRYSPAQPILSPNAAPGATAPSSTLFNRVKPQAAAGPRVGFLERFVAMVKSIIRSFRSAPPEGPRLRDPRQDRPTEPLLPAQSFRNRDPAPAPTPAPTPALTPASTAASTPAPTIADLELAPKSDGVLARALEHARTIGAEPHIHTLRAIAVFERDPTVANVSGVVEACAFMPRDDTNLSREIDRLGDNQLLEQARPFVLQKRANHSEMRLPASTFSDLRDVLRNMITQKVLPGITTVGSEQPGAT